MTFSNISENILRKALLFLKNNFTIFLQIYNKYSYITPARLIFKAWRVMAKDDFLGKGNAGAILIFHHLSSHGCNDEKQENTV